MYLRRAPGTEPPYANITANYEAARRAALDRGSAALLCVEADVIPPVDALDLMIRASADVTYGLYVWRGQRLWSAYSAVGQDDGLSLSADPVRAQRAWGRIIDVEGVGLGCTLIRRHVLETISFRYVVRNSREFSCDWTFAMDCRRLGFRQQAHLGVVCGHILHGPSGGVIWPDPTATGLYRIE